MIPCYICGKDIGGGWSIGFPPAPDSQKMGLCDEHDIISHRERVQKAWHELIYNNLKKNTQHAAYRAGDIPQLLSIYFMGGGSISLPCSSLSTMGGSTGDGKILKIITPAGEHIFFPLAQVRNYAISPMEHAAQPRQAHEARRQLPDDDGKANSPDSQEGTAPVFSGKKSTSPPDRQKNEGTDAPARPSSQSMPQDPEQNAEQPGDASLSSGPDGSIRKQGGTALAMPASQEENHVAASPYEDIDQ